MLPSFRPRRACARVFLSLAMAFLPGARIDGTRVFIVAFKGSIFLLSLVLAASMMPVHKPVIGFAVMLAVHGWVPDEPHKEAPAGSPVVAPASK